MVTYMSQVAGDFWHFHPYLHSLFISVFFIVCSNMGGFKYILPSNMPKQLSVTAISKLAIVSNFYIMFSMCFLVANKQCMLQFAITSVPPLEHNHMRAQGSGIQLHRIASKHSQFGRFRNALQRICCSRTRKQLFCPKMTVSI